MEQQQESQFASNEVLPEEQLPPASSFGERLANVFAGPGELFEELAIQPVKSSSWSIPFVLSLVITFGFVMMLFSTPSLRDQMMETQRQELQKKVDAKELTQEQADKASEMMGGDSPLIKIIGSISGVAIAAVVFFVVPLILWGAAKAILKFPGGYGKMLELYGLSSIIGLIGAVITLTMMIGLNTMYATPSAALALLGHYDRHNITHNLLASINIFTLWQVAVVGIGLGKVSRRSTQDGLMVAFVLWAIWAVFASLMGWGMR